MDYLTFISEIVKSLVWPLLVLAAGIAFRKNLKNLIDRLKSIDGTKMDFASVEIAKEQIVALEVQSKPIQEEVKEVEAKIVESQNKPEREELLQELNAKNEQLRKMQIESDMLRVQIISTNYDNHLASILHAGSREAVNIVKEQRILSSLKYVIISIHKKAFESIPRDELSKTVLDIVSGIELGSRNFPNLDATTLKYLRTHMILDRSGKLTDHGYAALKTIF